MKHAYLFSLLFSALIFSQNDAPSVAVLDFEANGIPDYEAETLTERLRSEIAKLLDQGISHIN